MPSVLPSVLGNSVTFYSRHGDRYLVTCVGLADWEFVRASDPSYRGRIGTRGKRWEAEYTLKGVHFYMTYTSWQDLVDEVF
jgi:hypothetical protein